MFGTLLLCASLNYTVAVVAGGLGRIDGWAARGGELALWGEWITRVRLTDARVSRVPAPAKAYTEGGAIWGRDLLLNEAEPHALVRYRGAAREQIAAGVVAADILPVTLFGRPGLAAVHRRMQIRFYWSEHGAWQEREIYSFYSHSGQGGLAAADIDGDGRTDLFAGNYWVRSPARFDLHWRLFAIDLWNETEHSGVMRLVERAGRVWAAQREMEPARLAVFERPPDPTQLWRERRLGADLYQPRGLAVADFDGDGALDVAAGEASGARRVVLFSRGTTHILHRGVAVLGLHAFQGDLYVVTTGSVLRLSRKRIP